MFCLHGIFTHKKTTFKVNAIVIISFFVVEASKAENVGNFPKITDAGSSRTSSTPTEKAWLCP